MYVCTATAVLLFKLVCREVVQQFFWATKNYYLLLCNSAEKRFSDGIHGSIEPISMENVKSL